MLASSLVLLTSASLDGDVGQTAALPDFDAGFARAAEILEAGQRPEAEKALETIRLRSAERAWEARIAFLLAGDDLRRRDFPAAVRRLRLAPAAAVGLEPYRQMLLGRALDAAGLPEEAAREYRAAFETEESFAARTACGRALAAVLEKKGDRKGALEVLSRAAGAATRSEAQAIATERIRLGLATNDAAAVRAAAHDLLLAGVAPEAAPAAPPSVRIGALTRLSRLDCDADRFEDALAKARAIARESPGAVAVFEPLWKLAWEQYRNRDFAGAIARMSALEDVFPERGRRRRLAYWRARSLEHEGQTEEAGLLYASLAQASPPDVYALFARRRKPVLRPGKAELLADPSTATATFRRTDELLRLRMFEEAAGEAAALPVSRGRDLRLAESQFALGRFPAATEAARRAFPDLGTASEGRVPDGWRRLFYPIEEKGFIGERAKEAGVDPALLRALVRQESIFDPRARSRAGALGLMQLMPATAKSLSRSVLRARYRTSFLYDPGVNARLGAAYFRSLLKRFDGNPVFALAAYNGGPTRMARILRENPGRDDDEVFESHPAYETRDYVRRVMLYAASYRELYPEH